MLVKCDMGMKILTKIFSMGSNTHRSRKAQEGTEKRKTYEMEMSKYKEAEEIPKC